jgi:hypothetical protein
MAASNSSLKSTTPLDKVRGWLELARLSIKDSGKHDFNDMREFYALHDSYTRKYLNKPFTACKVVEIGYGARPNRLIWFAGMGVDVTGIDLDQPILRGAPSEFLRVWRRNGWERALKSVARWFINERSLRKEMLTAISEERGTPFAFPAERLAVGDAADRSFWDKHENVDYIYSEDVFEHIPGQSIDGILSMMAQSMHPDGVAYVKPLIFTGITGGHHIEWFSGTFKLGPHKRRTDPWEHLRRNRHPADTYLNKLSRAEYRQHFLRYFDILEETVVRPDFGREYMTPELREELKQHSDEELFSNTVIFILKPLPRDRRAHPSR